MKDLNAFIEDLGKNKSLADKFKDVGDPAEVVKMAKKKVMNSPKTITWTSRWKPFLVE